MPARDERPRRRRPRRRGRWRRRSSASATEGGRDGESSEDLETASAGPLRAEASRGANCAACGKAAACRPESPAPSRIIRATRSPRRQAQPASRDLSRTQPNQIQIGRNGPAGGSAPRRASAAKGGGGGRRGGRRLWAMSPPARSASFEPGIKRLGSCAARGSASVNWDPGIPARGANLLIDRLGDEPLVPIMRRAVEGVAIDIAPDAGNMALGGMLPEVPMPAGIFDVRISHFTLRTHIG